MTPALVELLHEFDEGPARLGVEVGSRLVSQDHSRRCGQSPGDGNPLLLASGELVGPAMRQVGDVEGFQGLHRHGLPLPLGHAPQFEDERRVFQGGEDRDQVVRLKDEADFVEAQLSQGQGVELVRPPLAQPCLADVGRSRQPRRGRVLLPDPLERRSP